MEEFHNFYKDLCAFINCELCGVEHYKWQIIIEVIDTFYDYDKNLYGSTDRLSSLRSMSALFAKTTFTEEIERFLENRLVRGLVKWSKHAWKK